MIVSPGRQTKSEALRVAPVVKNFMPVIYAQRNYPSMRVFSTADPSELFVAERDSQVARRLDDVVIERDLFAFADRDCKGDGGDV
jgi:hypothetical protein